VGQREAGEWTLTSGRKYGNPFVDVDVEGVFRGPSGLGFAVPGFYDGTGGWRGPFCGLGVIHGWKNSWERWMVLEADQAGMEQFLLMRRFLHEAVPFHKVKPAPQLIATGGWDFGHRPSALADGDLGLAAVYLPAGGAVELNLPKGKRYVARWFGTRTGRLRPASPAHKRRPASFCAPPGGRKHPWDWVLVLRER